MTIINQNGHLDRNVLQAFAAGSLCEAERAEVVQHLAKCDDCLLAMCALEKEEIPLLQPSRDVCAAAHREFFAAKGWGVLQRMSIVAAAVLFVMAAWKFDFFGHVGTAVTPKNDSLSQSTAQFSQNLNEWNNQFADFLGNIFATPSSSGKP